MTFCIGPRVHHAARRRAIRFTPRSARCPCAITFQIMSIVSCPGVMVSRALIPRERDDSWTIFCRGSGAESPALP